MASEPCSEVTSGCFQEVSKCTVACVTLLCSHRHPLQDSPPSQTDADPLDTHTPPKPHPTCCLCESGSSGISDEWVLQDQSLSARLVLRAACSADLLPSVCLITRRLWAGAPGAPVLLLVGFGAFAGWRHPVPGHGVPDKSSPSAVTDRHPLCTVSAQVASGFSFQTCL